MDNPFEDEQIGRITDIMESDGPAAAAAKILEYLDEQNNIQLHIAVTGESGSGKSTFVNAFRGVDNRDEGAAPTGCVETTMEVKPYLHPKYPNVTLWDLPGIGTMKFPADKYLQHVGFDRFDFFIIISADRFRENDVKLALEIQKMKKKFYFVRSKIDHNLQDEERRQNEKFNAEKTLQGIRKDCIQGLVKQGVESPQVFLVSSFDLHLYDFKLLQETMERELPAHKRDALLLAMPIISLEVISKKKVALQAKIKYFASASALTASEPIPGLSCAADVTMLAEVITAYKVTFGLDPESLQNLADNADMLVDDLRALMTSSLSANELSTDLIMNELYASVGDAALMAADEGSRLIPSFGIPAEMTLSYAFTYEAFSTSLEMLAGDAERVFSEALGLGASV